MSRTGPESLPQPVRNGRKPRWHVEPLTGEFWGDLERLFGSRGACGGCWCMTPRLTSAVYERNKGDANRRALLQLVINGPPPGVLGFLGDQPIGWCSIEPREKFVRLANSRILAPVDDRPVWSIVCLFIAKDFRGQGYSRKLIEGAVDFARQSGAKLIEAYPVEPRQERMPDAFAWTGLASSFRAAKFQEVARRSETRPIMRRAVRMRRTGK